MKNTKFGYTLKMFAVQKNLIALLNFLSFKTCYKHIVYYFYLKKRYKTYLKLLLENKIFRKGQQLIQYYNICLKTFHLSITIFFVLNVVKYLKLRNERKLT